MKSIYAAEPEFVSSAVDQNKNMWSHVAWRWSGSFFIHRNMAAEIASDSLAACDYLGERMASLFGITSAKYQYAIDEYYRMKKEVRDTEVLLLLLLLWVCTRFTSWCHSLCDRGRKRKRKTACRRRRNDPSTSLRTTKTKRSPRRSCRRRPMLALVWPIRSRMKTGRLRGPS